MEFSDLHSPFSDSNWLRRCSQLAQYADNRVRDNPYVGAVLVHGERAIGEGWHRRAGHAHAEVNCLDNVQNIHKNLISDSTLYVSLEPCCFQGRTPPCTDLILRHGIPRVVFAQRDPTPEVAGRGAALLRAAGVDVTEYPDYLPTQQANRNRFTLVTRRRPFIFLKYARSADGFLRPADRSLNYWITNAISRRLVHRWRTRTSAVLVGANTWTEDRPRLDARLFPGPDPLRIVLNPRGVALSPSPAAPPPIELRPKDLHPETLTGMLRQLITDHRISHLTVEGGAATLEAFIAAGLWDEAAVFTGTARFGSGLPAPRLTNAEAVSEERIGSDRLEWFKRQPPSGE